MRLLKTCVLPEMGVIVVAFLAPCQRDSRYYSVDLDRGPSGFGFSLRGGSEYNMGLYVLGLMEGGPASRSQKIQVVPDFRESNFNLSKFIQQVKVALLRNAK